jgi:hypothetical protein
MNALASLLLITTLSIPTTTLVLRDGHRIEVDGPIREENGRILFVAHGSFYSIAFDEVDLTATRAAVAPPVVVSSGERARLKVSPEERDRLLRDLEQNHSGTPGPKPILEPPPYPTPQEKQQTLEDEWAWRTKSRSYDERVRQAEENRDLLIHRAEQLKAQISGFLSLGFKPAQFTYQSTELEYTVAQIPAAQLEVDRAERARDQFHDDARRLGILPGWLR